MKPLSFQEVAAIQTVSHPLLERLRALSLAAARGEPSGKIVWLEDPTPDHLGILAAMTREDGGEWIEGRGDDAPKTVGSALAIEMGSLAGHARRIGRALDGADRWSAIALLDVDLASEETARWWWSVARRLHASGACALWIATTRRDRATSPWRAIGRTLADSVPVHFCPLARESAPVRASSARPVSPEGMRRGIRARALIRLAVSAMRGDADPSAVESVLARASAGARFDDDARAATAAAIVALVEESSDADSLARNAVAAALLADDPGLIASAALVSACVATTRGDDARARKALAGARTDLLASPLRTLAEALTARLAPGDTPGPRTSCDRADAWLWLLDAAGESTGEIARERARALFERSGAFGAARSLDLATRSGLSRASGGDGSSLVEGLAPLAAAQDEDSVASAALDALLAVVPARGGRVVESHDPRDAAEPGRPVLARRGSALFGSAGTIRLVVPLRAHTAAAPFAIVLLDRTGDDPPFSRDERRLADSVAAVAAARIEAVRSSLQIERMRSESKPPAPAPREEATSEASLETAERTVVVATLASNGGNLSRTARSLGLSRNGLKLKMARHGLRPIGFARSPRPKR